MMQVFQLFRAYVASVPSCQDDQNSYIESKIWISDEEIML
jgi:hypothetical protein